MGYQNNIDKEVFRDTFESLAKKVQKYGGKFVFLWHNSAFDTIFSKQFYQILISSLNGLK